MYPSYTIHVGYMNDYVPLIYALLPNKEEGTYERFFRAVKSLAPAAQPSNVLNDFELAAMNATPNSNLTLSRCVEGDPAFAVLPRHIPALAFVPAAQVLNAYTTLGQTLPNEMLPILDCFERTYIGRRIGAHRRAPTYSTEFWNVHEKVINDDPRTNNKVEDHHNLIN